MGLRREPARASLATHPSRGPLPPAQPVPDPRGAEDAPHAVGDLGETPAGGHAEGLGALPHLIRARLRISLGVSLAVDGARPSMDPEVMLPKPSRLALAVALAAVAGCGGGSSPTQ